MVAEKSELPAENRVEAGFVARVDGDVPGVFLFEELQPEASRQKATVFTPPPLEMAGTQECHG